MRSRQYRAAVGGSVRRERGIAAIEWLIVAPAVLACGFGVLQWALLLHGRQLVEYAAFVGARAGATEHAEPDAITDAIATGLIPIRPAALASVPVSVSSVPASSLFRAELAAGIAQWRQLRPTADDFADWGAPALDAEGDPIPSGLEIPNDNLRYRGSAVGPRSGRTLADANVLEIELVYGWPMRVPLIGPLAVRWMQWIDGCVDAPARDGLAGRWATPDWRADAGGWRCPYYRAGGVPRWPLRVVASVRMHSPARTAADATSTSSAPSGTTQRGTDTAGGPTESPEPADANGAADPPAPGAAEAGGEIDGADRAPSGEAAHPAGDGDSPGSDAPAGPGGDTASDDGDVDDALDVADRADISQPGECFDDSGQAVVDVGDEEAALAAAVEPLAAETVAVEAR